MSAVTMASAVAVKAQRVGGVRRITAKLGGVQLNSKSVQMRRAGASPDLISTPERIGLQPTCCRDTVPSLRRPVSRVSWSPRRFADALRIVFFPSLR